MVVTATRDTEEIRKIPANVTVITKEEIEQSNAQTILDLLRDEVGVVVRDLLGTGKNGLGRHQGFWRNRSSQHACPGGWKKGE